MDAVRLLLTVDRTEITARKCEMKGFECFIDRNTRRKGNVFSQIFTAINVSAQILNCVTAIRPILDQLTGDRIP